MTKDQEVIQVVIVCDYVVQMSLRIIASIRPGNDPQARHHECFRMMASNKESFLEILKSVIALIINVEVAFIA
eukprot:CAMPEP_0180423602 /NCGR_PEP_ID=MMETSP1036_2-20121128/4302_1 /TAXON_ID=632150 /ORGANISM="Azadinium spinosum, Strain 3D9" /LENGTH=72 /DNA_ID=CAMNT_0022429005 /DNA_START=684 /DNA_END=902 /DNA_ORIENTATION=+